VIYNDHNPLTYDISQKRDNCSPRQFKYLDLISQFTTDIRHISGQDNVVADALSRVEAVCASVSPEALVEELVNDAKLAALLHGHTALRLEKNPVPGSDFVIPCDTSAARPRPMFPQPSGGRCSTLHVIGHLGTRAKGNVISQPFVWPGVQKDCRRWT
jgi:hypothetical protein